MATNQEKKSTNKYYYALGRRKTATATVRLYEGTGTSEINGKKVSEYLPGKVNGIKVTNVLQVADLDPKNYYFTVVVKGSGKSAQLGAIQHGLARAIVKMDSSLKKPLKVAGYMKRDPRMVERKKPGLHKARKAEQFSKR